MVTFSKYVYMGNDNDTPVNYVEGECLSSDTKPTENIYNGSKLMEMDTATLYMFDQGSAQWVPWE